MKALNLELKKVDQNFLVNIYLVKQLDYIVQVKILVENFLETNIF